jgi:hypothetical protein
MTEDLQKPAMPDTHEQLTFVLKLFGDPRGKSAKPAEDVELVLPCQP